MWSAIREHGHWEGLVWNRRKDGRIYPQQLTITAVRDGTGRTTHYVGDGRDVSEQRRAAADRASIDAARQVQQDLFPLKPPSLPGFDIAGAVFPAERVSGDYYDFLPLSASRQAIVVADVSGHGLGPALLMAQTQAYLRALADAEEDPGAILTGVNRLFAPRDGGRFVTLFLGALDVESRRFAYAGAGHQGYLLDAAGNLTTLRATGLPLGVMPGKRIATSRSIALAEGDILLLATDGCEEAEGPGRQPFGRRRMLDVVRAYRHRPAGEIIEALRSALREFSQGLPQADDITLVVVKA
jgi:sigma-B regulation protein RsbU (phosphoserine phosphatase)